MKGTYVCLLCKFATDNWTEISGHRVTCTRKPVSRTTSDLFVNGGVSMSELVSRLEYWSNQLDKDPTIKETEQPSTAIRLLTKILRGVVTGERVAMTDYENRSTT